MILTPLILACLLTLTLWVPYFLAWVPSKGPARLLGGNPKEDQDTKTPAWAQRLQQAHQNAVENLAAFVGVCLAAHLAGTPTELTVQLAYVYVIARLVHYVCYGLAIPVVRTLAFMAGWFATFGIGIGALMQLGF